MLPPHELKTKGFTHVMRGYSSAEVDEYAEFVLQKYTELYRANDELETKISELSGQLEKYKSDEESIRSALVEAQKSSTQIVEDANERSKIILRSAKLECDRILSEFKSAVTEERDELLLLRGMVKKFKSDLFLSYQTHIEYIEKIAPELDNLDESEFSDEAVIRLAVESIKGDILSDAGSSEEDSASVGAAEGETPEETSFATVPEASEESEISEISETSEASEASGIGDETDESVAVNTSGEVGEYSEEISAAPSDEVLSGDESGNEDTEDELDSYNKAVDDELSDIISEISGDGVFTGESPDGSAPKAEEIDYGVTEKLKNIVFDPDVRAQDALGLDRSEIAFPESSGRADSVDESTVESDEFLIGDGMPENSIKKADDTEDDDSDYLDFLKDITESGSNK